MEPGKGYKRLFPVAIWLLNTDEHTTFGSSIYVVSTHSMNEGTNIKT